MSIHTAKRRKLTKTDPPDIKEDLCNCLRSIDSDKATASVLDDQKQNLDKVFARWSKQDQDPISDPHTESWFGCHSARVYGKLVYVFEHKYPEANIGLEHFRAKDQLQTRYLLEACQGHGFCFYFAQFEFSVYGHVEDDPTSGNGADYHEMFHEIESSLKLWTIFQDGGKQLAESIDLERDDFIENVDFDGLEPNEEEFDGSRGSDGYTATHLYLRTCAVIVPRARRYDFLLHAETVDVPEYVELLLRELDNDPSSVALQDEMKRFCALVIDPSSIHTRRNGFKVGLVTDKDRESIGKAILRLDCPDLLENLGRGTQGPVGLALFKELGRGLVERDISLWHYGIDLAIWSIRTVSERLKAVDLLMSNYREAGGNDAATMQRMQKFERDWAINVGETPGRRFSVSPANAQALMQLSEKYGEDFTFEVVLPIVKKHHSDVGFIVAYLTMLFQAVGTDTLRTEVVEKLFKDILAHMIPDLNLHCPTSPDFDLSDPGDESPEVMSAENLTVVFFQCEQLGLAHEIDQLANKIISEASRVRTATFERILLPLLKQLPPVVKQNCDHVDNPSYVRILRTVIPSYINTYVQSPPQKPTGFEPQSCDCTLHCEDCVGFDAFLQNPDKVTTYFHNISANRSDHLVERIKESTCSTEITKQDDGYKLKMTKRGLAWENAMREWNQRCGFALEKVEEIGVERLTSLLGKGWEVDYLPVLADLDLSNDHGLLGE